MRMIVLHDADDDGSVRYVVVDKISLIYENGVLFEYYKLNTTETAKEILQKVAAVNGC